jgi:adenylosuccinate synthase
VTRPAPLRRNTLILGAQWGDEGKGKITHWLAREAAVVARYAGGNNAGHTVVIGEEVYKLHQIPSGIFYPKVLCLLGNGMVIDPAVLLEEMDGLAARGVTLDHLRVSLLAHLIMPYHRWLDGQAEERRGENSIGTTRRGIGPAYADKIARVGVRTIDLLDEAELRERIEFNFREKADALENSGLSATAVFEQYRAFGARLRPYLADTSALICERYRRGERILFEGAQGALLDIDLGTYPYVTSSNAGPGYAGAGLGVPPRAIERVLGVSKAYATRVGAGPFPTELDDATGERLRAQGGEFGTTTGRPRRCGWLDLVALRTVCRVHGVDALALTKLDVLDGFPELGVATAYRLDGATVREVPLSTRAFERCAPIYETMEGWERLPEQVSSLADLPPAARAYVRRIEDEVGVPIEIVSIGAEDEKTVLTQAAMV